MPVRCGLVRLVLLRGRRSVVALRGRSTVLSGGATVTPRGGGPVSLLVRRMSSAASAVAIALVILDHHLNVALRVVGRFSNTSQGNAASGGVGPGVRLGWNLDTAAGPVLKLFDSGATFADDKPDL